MNAHERVNILLVDDQHAKLLSHEAILAEIGENLLKASSASQAFECLLKNEIALVLIDVCMPDLDGFELAAMIREHPRFETTAIIFVSAVMMTYPDQLRGYQLGGVDYVPGTGGFPSYCGPRSRCSWICTARLGNSNASMQSSSSASPSEPPNCNGSTSSWNCGSRSGRASGK